MGDCVWGGFGVRGGGIRRMVSVAYLCFAISNFDLPCRRSSLLNRMKEYEKKQRFELEAATAQCKTLHHHHNFRRHHHFDP